MSLSGLSIEQRIFKALARTAQSALMYPRGSEQQGRSAELFLRFMEMYAKPVRISLMGTEAVIEDKIIEEPTTVEVLFIRNLTKHDWESIRIESGIDKEGVLDLVFDLVDGKAPPVEGRGYSVGFLTLENARSHGTAIPMAAVGYISLLSQSKSVYETLGDGRSEGFDQAKGIVAALAGHLAKGLDIFKPIRNIKSYDEYTFTHGLNVSILTMALGRAVLVPDEILEGIVLGALCHDVGKKMVPREILNKPGKLEHDEKKIVDRHPVEGARILMALPNVPSIVPVIAYQHHMYKDGTGYPFGVHGINPHPASMLVSMADVFDALRTIRPYSHARTTNTAYNIILKEARQGKLQKVFLGPLAGLSNIFTKGTRVKLSNGKQGAVSQENVDDPLHPVIVLDDGPSIDLGENRTLLINEVI